MPCSSLVSPVATAAAATAAAVLWRNVSKAQGRRRWSQNKDGPGHCGPISSGGVIGKQQKAVIILQPTHLRLVDDRHFMTRPICVCVVLEHSNRLSGTLFFFTLKEGSDFVELPIRLHVSGNFEILRSAEYWMKLEMSRPVRSLIFGCYVKKKNGSNPLTPSS